MLNSLSFPLFFVGLLWAVKLLEVAFDLQFYTLGIKPLDTRGLVGIATAPLIHGDFGHLTANTFPLLFLSTGIFYFYRPVAFRVFFLTYLMTGIWVWAFARGAQYHIGASGLVYACGSFLFFSGIIRRNKRLAAISLIVVFLYGGMFWGIFPMKEHISWESHLMGFLAGIVTAVYYRKRAPYSISLTPAPDEEPLPPPGEEKDFISEEFSQTTSTDESLSIHYSYTEKDETP